MLKVKLNEYEVEEEIAFTNKDGENVYEYTMQITAQELEEIKEIVTGTKYEALIETIDSLEKEKKQNEADEKRKELNKMAKADQERFEDIVFKDHKGKILEVVPKLKYDEMIEVVHDFFWKSFIDKRTKQIKSMTTDLRKISKI